MPIFGSKHTEPEPAPAPRTSTSSSHGFFNRRRSTSPDVSSPARSSTTSSSGIKNVLHRGREDPSITQARDRVAHAEESERQADKALIAARAAVKEAREHVRRLELDAAEEARLAKIKQGQAANISKSAKGLGRHG